MTQIKFQLTIRLKITVNDSIYSQYYQNKEFKKDLSLYPEECDSIKYSFSTSHASYLSYEEYLNLLSNSNLMSK